MNETLANSSHGCSMAMSFVISLLLKFIFEIRARKISPFSLDHFYISLEMK
jgi:hypothetical protein